MNPGVTRRTAIHWLGLTTLASCTSASAVEATDVPAIQAVSRLGPFPGTSQSRGNGGDAWDWDSHDITIPPSCAPGAYIGVLRQCDDAGAPTDDAPDLTTTNGEMKFLFVVRGTQSAPILVKLPLFTYQAYNTTGGTSLYGVWDQVHVTLKRPGGGTGHSALRPGEWSIYPDLFDPYGVPRDEQWNTFERWDAKLLRWLTAHGYAFDVCTDWDLHVDSALLSPYRLLISNGHDEYWSDAMRDQAEAFIARGGNVAFFGGNTCFWRVEVDVASATLACNKIDNSAGRWDTSDANGAVRYENSLTGLCMHAGGYSSHAREPLGYTIAAADFWVFRDSGLATGDTFGAAAGIVGYEVDGAPIDASGALTFARTTPANLHVLARALLPPGNPSPDGWMSAAADDPVPSPGSAAVAIYNRIGTVFNVGTTDWPRVLATGDAATTAITHNVIQRLSTRTLHVRERACLDVVAMTSVTAPGMRAIVATSDGDLHALRWDESSSGCDVRTIDRVPGARQVAALDEADGVHVIVATSTTIVERIWTPGNATTGSTLAELSAVALTARRDGSELVAIVASDAGDIVEIRWTSGTPARSRIVAHVPGATSLAAYADRVIVGTTTGEVVEHAPAGQRTLGQFAWPIAALSAFSVNDHHLAAIATLDGNVYTLAWRDGQRAERDVLPYFGDTSEPSPGWPGVTNVRALAAYRLDRSDHVLVAASGAITELSWT